jgi:hypothetical protein
MENKAVKKREYLTICIMDPALRKRLEAVAQKEYRALGRQAAWFIEQGLSALDLREQKEAKVR